jgi:CARDB
MTEYRKKSTVLASAAAVTAVAAGLVSPSPAQASAHRPDLVERTVTVATKTVSAGASLVVHDIVINNGSAKAGASHSRFYLSTNTTVGKGDILLGQTRSVPALAPKASSVGSTHLTVPTGVADGSYHVLACADGAAKVVESNEKNNCRATSNRLALKSSNLVTKQVSAPPANPVRGQQFSLTATIANTGKSTAATSVIGFYLSSDVNGGGGDVRLGQSRPLTTLKAGASATSTTSLAIPMTTEPGTWHVLACADDNLKVLESSETDNCHAAASTLTITSTAVTADITLDTARAVTHDFQTDADSVSTTDANGTTYTLSLPDHALLSAELITMTPITSLTGTPLSSTVSAGVDLQPDGLVLSQPATLTITPATPIPVDQQIGFSSRSDGSQFHPYPLNPDPHSIVFTVNHFTDYDIEDADAADQQTMAADIPDTTVGAIETDLAPITVAERSGTISGAEYLEHIDANLLPDFANTVKPMMQAAEKDSALTWEALPLGDVWSSWPAKFGFADKPPYAGDIAWIQDAKVAILKNDFDTAYKLCTANVHVQSQYWRMVGDAHSLSFLGTGASEATTVLGKDVADKIAACSGSYHFTLQGSAKSTYPESDGLAFVADGGDVDAINIPLNHSCNPLGGCFYGFGDMLVSNITSTENPDDVCSTSLPSTATGTMTVDAFVLDVNPMLNQDPSDSPHGQVGFTPEDSENVIEDCASGTTQGGATDLIEGPMEAALFARVLTTSTQAVNVPHDGEYAMSGPYTTGPPANFDVDFTVSVTNTP